MSKAPPAKAPTKTTAPRDETDDDSPEAMLGTAPAFPGWPTLYAKNVEEVRRWYRNATSAGREVKHIVLCEMIFGHLSKALSMALQGKQWSPPAHLP
jgi:hypothetical protein